MPTKLKTPLFAYCILSVLAFNTCLAQINPPGLGKTNLASWFAIGIRQELDTIEGKGWQSMSYIGAARKSTPDNHNLFMQPAILIVNQEFHHQFHHNWQYSIAASYRRQQEYLKTAPYELDSPKLKQEFRIYSRLSYIFKVSRIKITPTIRQEIRKFCSSDFKPVSEDWQFRSRIRIQLSINLDARKIHRLIASSEQLFSISKKSKPKQWTDFNYRESRFSIYYSFSPQNLPLIFNFGYMNNLVGNKNPYCGHYLAFDVIVENPFKLKQRNKDRISENLE